MVAQVRVYRLYTQIDDHKSRMQICIDADLRIDDSCIYAAHGHFELNVWPARFALFEATGGEMVRVPQNVRTSVLEMETPSYFTWD